MSRQRLYLSYGNPGFLQELWASAVQNSNTVTTTASNMPYILGDCGIDELQKSIKQLHQTYRNCLIDDQSQIVVTAGASQAIQASLWAHKQLDKSYPADIIIPTPYWGRFEGYAEHERYTVNYLVNQDTSNCVFLTTTPNNPDGALNLDQKADIRDCCYNWPQYTDSLYLAKDPVVIFSLSKLSGHSSTRIGWAIVRNPEIAAKMQEYIENYSSGVSIEAQLQAVNVLNTLTAQTYLLSVARAELVKRQITISHIINEYSLPIKNMSKDGMFLYWNCRPQIVYDLHINCVAGSSCGDTRKDMFRINLGCDQATYEEFTKRLINLGKTYIINN